jgi:hypothetical protein
MTKVLNDSNSAPKNPKTNSTQVGGFSQPDQNKNPRNGGPF